MNLDVVVGMHMPSLHYLDLSDNNMTIRQAFETESFPNLIYLYLNGNRVKVFPSETLRLMYVGIARCNLDSLPRYLALSQYLKYLDARDNNLMKIDDELKSLIKRNDVESYFSGNPVLCKSDKSVDCEPLCSKTCWSRKVSGDGICDESCLSEECKFDGGDCMQ